MDWTAPLIWRPTAGGIWWKLGDAFSEMAMIKGYLRLAMGYPIFHYIYIYRNSRNMLKLFPIQLPLWVDDPVLSWGSLPAASTSWWFTSLKYHWSVWVSLFEFGIHQGLVNVPFWGYWTSPYSRHLVDHIPNGWVMFNGDMTNDPCTHLLRHRQNPPLRISPAGHDLGRARMSCRARKISPRHRRSTTTLAVWMPSTNCPGLRSRWTHIIYFTLRVIIVILTLFQFFLT